MSDSHILQAALRYSKLEWSVLPIHGIVSTSCGNRCACWNARTTGTCPNKPGKHPAVRNWLNAASSDPAVIRSWFQHTTHNLAIRTGSGLVVLDIDPDRGGDESLAALEARIDGLPTTVTAVTGSGGKHLFFRCSAEIRNSVNLLGRGIDVRGDGGYVVAPPSVHISGNRYRWAEGLGPGRIALAPLPHCLAQELVRTVEPTAAAPSARHATSDYADVPFQQEELPSIEERIRRGRCLAESHPGAIPGSGAQTNAFKLALGLVRGLCLPSDDALQIMQANYNHRCTFKNGSPYPWSETELRRKIADAMNSDRCQWGYLLGKRNAA